MAETICMHCYVRGLVQGVWFRASTQEKAQQLGMTGWVKNLADGRVEVLACGDREQVNALHEWLKEGPPRAKVEEVSYEELPLEEHNEFVVR